MVPVLASLAVAAALLVAAGLKLADRTGAAVALTTYGLHGRAARAAVWAAAGWELILAGGLLVGLPAAGWAAAATLGVFAAAQAALVAVGRGGLPCGCLGARGRLSAAGAARTAALAGAAVAGAGASPAAVPAAAVAALAFAAVVALRPRIPDGALEIAGEGPAVGERTALDEWLPPGEVRLAVFTSAQCRLCRELGGALERLVADDVAVLRTYEQERDREVWAAVDVPGAPFAVALDAEGRVLAKGTVNDERQLRSVVAAATERRASRRAVLAGAAAAAVAPSVGALVAPGTASAYHFCGHIYTTDGCPHPTGLPRIDARGRPLRARDGHPVDDLGRPVDRDGLPVDDEGRPLTDTDGRRLPAAPRSRVCDEVARRFGIRTRVDGAWYRCCDGRVRKLVDCCTTGRRRINGDRALQGYCYEGRRVFCVLYYDTRVPC